MKPNKASATAYLIAASTVYLSKDPAINFLVPTDWAAACSWFVEEYSLRGRILLKLIPKSWFRPFIRLIEKRGVPGWMTHVILRKHCLEQTALKYLEQGFSQVVVLGAGFDTSAIRLHQRFPKVNFLEVDFPATQEIKVKALAKHNLPKSNMSFVPVDFTTENWNQKLLAHSLFDRMRDTIFIVEGVLMYLTDDEVKNVLSFVGDRNGAKRSVAFTFMEKGLDGSISFRNSSKSVDFWLKRRGEIFKWGIEPERLPSFLQSAGLRMLNVFRADDFRKAYLHGIENVTIAEGEDVCVAEKL